MYLTRFAAKTLAEVIENLKFVHSVNREKKHFFITWNVMENVLCLL